jgi:catechol 2,3-dioxygenase-like lactoylglutathione lyase family enzyme
MTKCQTGIIHHIELYVSNLQKSTEFWGWLLESLDYKVFQQWDHGISWIKENTYIVLVQTKQKYLDIPYNRCRTGMNHIAFYASSKEHIDQIVISLKEKGIKILYEDRHPYAGGKDIYAVYFEDPDRIKIELVAPEQTYSEYIRRNP